MTTSNNNNIIGVLLAGGLSRRMFANDHRGGDGRRDVAQSAGASSIDSAVGCAASARDKCLELLDDRPMLAHVIERIAPQVTHLVLNANGDPARFSAFNLPVIADPVEGFAGPLAGVLAGMRWTRRHYPGATHIVTVSTDAPFIPHDLVSKLAEAATQNPAGAIVIASSNGQRQPVIGLWPVTHADDLQRQLEGGLRKVLQWTDQHGTVLCDFAMTIIAGNEIDPFFNANHPHELIEARRLLRLGASH